MQSFIGIYDTSYDYAVSLTEYVNRRRDFGFNAVAFKNTSEIRQFLTSNKLSYLIINNQIHLNKYNTEKVFFLCEEKSDLSEAQGKNLIFKYQKAEDIIKSILPVRENNKKSCIDVVFSFGAIDLGVEYVRSGHAKQTRKQSADTLQNRGMMPAMSKTLLILWDPFCDVDDEIFHINLSDALFMFGGNGETLKKTLSSAGDNQITVMSGINYYSDIWEFSPCETEEFVKICMNYGNFDRVIIVCAFLSPGTEKFMELADTVTLVGGSMKTHENFKNQMKYAGKHEILMKLKTAET